MPKIDPKWINIDEEKMVIIEDEETGQNELSIRDDIIADLDVSYINGSSVEVRTVADGLPPEDEERDMSKDFVIQIPNPV